MNRQELAALLEQELIKQRQAEEESKAQRKMALEAQLQTAASSAPDVSGIAQAIDAIYGTQIGAPVLMQQKRQDEQLARLDEMLMKQEPTGTNYAAQLAKLYDDERDKGKEQRQMLNLQTSAFRDVKKDLADTQGKVAKYEGTFTQADEALSSLDRTRINTILSDVLRNVGNVVGAQTEQDIQRAWFNTVGMTVDDYLTKLAGKGTVKLDPTEVQELVALVRVARENVARGLGERLALQSELYQSDPVYSTVYQNVKKPLTGLAQKIEGLAESKIDFTKANKSPLAGLPGSGVTAPVAPGTLTPRQQKILEQMRKSE